MISRNYFKGDSMKLNRIINADCMEIMKDIPDKYFELAIVDPPYGIGEDGRKGTRTSPSRPNSYNRPPKYKPSKWDENPPNKKYFDELVRVSKNQIIWGANHFISKISIDSPCWIVWDKNNIGTDFADCELAWTSFNTAVRKYFGHKFIGTRGGKDCIHPTQKPVALYRWLLQNYAKPGDKIIDTHSGSGSLACACHLEKFDFLAIELDEDYYRDSVKRLDELRSQGVLF
jgi:site-specific DNA-methyltransferase (adenine-specific)